MLTELLGRREHELDDDLVLRALSQVRHLPDRPGRAFVHSNIGYVLLAEMVRRATGTAPGVLAERWLFQPLGLTSARWGGPAITTFPGAVPPPATNGDGGLWLSTEDLARWLDALDHDALGAGVGRLLRSTGHLDDGTEIAYAWGCTRREDPGGALCTHGGAWPGWTTKTVRQPATGTSVAPMTLGAEATAGRLFHNLLAAVAEFEHDLIVERTPDGLAAARARGRFGGARPRLDATQAATARGMHHPGRFTVTAIAETFGVTRSTIYRHLDDEQGTTALSTSAVGTARRPTGAAPAAGQDRQRR